ncbi:hypothetical protein BYT27DRAFT_7243409 [Phlegmacium glaucopus]|nr:hypothetical protein BYT27DRAFT_7243409 [Phlegmacium glaucopus]
MLACLPLPQKTPRKQCKPNSGAPTLGIRGDTNISVLSTYTRPMLLEKLISAHLMHVVPVRHFNPGAPLDAIKVGDVPWKSFSVSFDGEIPEGDTTAWKHASYDVWFRDPHMVLKNQLKNPDFAKEMDVSPKIVRDEGGRRQYTDFMSGDWAWRQADEIAKNPENHGATFCPTILGSDKTTVLVATGQNEYYPLYLSNGLVHNNVRRAHRNALTLIAFLAIPKRMVSSDALDAKDTGRRAHQHTEAVFEALRTKEMWDDYGIIDDIMSQLLTSITIFSHSLMDFWHIQRPLVTWVTDYINEVHTPAEAKKILADIDRRIAAAPPFPDLQ